MTEHNRPEAFCMMGLVVAGGGLGLAAGGTSSSATQPTASKTAASPARTATINVATVTVAGKSEQVLVNAWGLPLYTYSLDTPSQSRVRGGLAALWPALVSASPSEVGASGKLSVIADSNGQQVLYNGHFLYTFIDDTPGHVTGQDVQGFFVATPGLGARSASAAPSALTIPGLGTGYSSATPSAPVTPAHTNANRYGY
jgi:predicted lipoprotein with Yx(FWY)xxD motif